MTDDANHPASPAAEDGREGLDDRARRLLWPGGLTARLFILSVVFVALASLLILAASLATFEERWLLDRVNAAEVASLAVKTAPDQVISSTMRKKLQEQSGAEALVFQKDGDRLFFWAPPSMSPYVVDLRSQNVFEWLAAPIRTLTSGEDAKVLVRAHTESYPPPDFVEIVTSDAQLKSELVSYFLRLLVLTLFISAAGGAAVYISLNVFLVKPMQRITRAMERFRADPDDPAAHIEPSGRRDEVGRAEVELNRMQADLRAALASRARLAALGEAVAKINHDLRNMVTSAQIASERLAMSGDPSVAQALPRLERALDRAARLTTEVMAYGKSTEPEASPVTVLLKPAVEAAAEDAGINRAGVAFTTKLSPGDRVLADPDHLHRMLLNLLKNARQALTTPEQTRPPEIRLELVREGDESRIRIIDNGPGVPARALDRLFTPFTGSGRPGGTGLGLAISRELAQAHGGDLRLVETSPEGSVFEIVLPGSIEPRAAARKTA